MAKDIKIIVSKLYPKVKAQINPAMISRFKKLMSEFLDKRSASLYDIAPCDRIYYTPEDAEEFAKCINISHSDVLEILSQTYYYPMAAFNPASAKDPNTILILCVLRYFFLERKTYPKELELITIYFAFSGKFYPSIHYGSYPKFAPSENRHIMEYVVNKKLTEKYDIKKYGNVIGAVKSICATWLETYDAEFKSFDDEDIVYLIQQLHTRIKSFTINIAVLYYDAYDNKEYMTYNSDNLSEDKYRLADNDSLRIERVTQQTMNSITSNGVNYRICKLCSNSLIKTDEIKSIIEAIIDDKSNMPIISELVSLLVSQYFLESENKDVTDISFISKSVAVKPNSKDPNVNRMKEIIEEWLNDNSAGYSKRKSRLATKSAYQRAILTYFVMLIHFTATGNN